LWRKEASSLNAYENILIEIEENASKSDVTMDDLKIPSIVPLMKINIIGRRKMIILLFYMKYF